MFNIRRVSIVMLLLVMLSLFGQMACNNKTIEGTKIEDCEETRAIIKIIETYRRAMETREADILIALASKNYFEKNGDANSTNNYDYEGLIKFLRSSEFRQISSVKMTIVYKDIELNEARNVAKVTYYYTSNYKMPPATFEQKTVSEGGETKTEDNFDEELWFSKSDDNEMILELEDGQWFISKGM